MSDYKDKIITSQTITNDLMVEISAMLSRNNFDKDDLQPLYTRIKELATTLNEIPTQDIKL